MESLHYEDTLALSKVVLVIEQRYVVIKRRYCITELILNTSLRLILWESAILNCHLCDSKQQLLQLHSNVYAPTMIRYCLVFKWSGSWSCTWINQVTNTQRGCVAVTYTILHVHHEVLLPPPSYFLHWVNILRIICFVFLIFIQNLMFFCFVAHATPFESCVDQNQWVLEQIDCRQHSLMNAIDRDNWECCYEDMISPR